MPIAKNITIYTYIYICYRVRFILFGKIYTLPVRRMQENFRETKREIEWLRKTRAANQPPPPSPLSSRLLFLLPIDIDWKFCRPGKGGDWINFSKKGEATITTEGEFLE